MRKQNVLYRKIQAFMPTQHFGPLGAKGDGNPAPDSFDTGKPYKPQEMDSALIDVVVGDKPILRQDMQYQVGIHNK